MPKKPAANAFYFFMKEMRNELATKGINVAMKDMSEQASDPWKKLSESEKKRYDMMAKNAQRGSKLTKLTNERNAISTVLEMTEKQRIFNENMITEINHTIEIAGENLGMVQFYIIHINTFCFVNSCHRYYPAEVAVVHFNLNDGVANAQAVYHSLCKPGELPLGYAFVVKDYAAATHQIDYPIDEPSNLETVFTEILEFIKQDVKRGYALPPLYAFDKNIPVCTEVIQKWCSDFGYREDYIKVYALEQLFYYLRNGFSKLQGLPCAFPSLSSGRLELEKDVYDYSRGISCALHENSDVSNYCSKSFAVRWAYIICDNCCQDWKIELIPGQHVPKQAEVRSANKAAAKKHPYPSIAVRSNENESSATDLPSTSSLHETAESSFIETDIPSQANDSFNPGSYGSQEVAQRDYSFISCSQESSQASVLSVDMNDTISETSFTSYTPAQAPLPRRPFTLSAALAQRGRALASSTTKGTKFSGTFNKLSMDDLLNETSPSDYPSQDNKDPKKRM